MRRGSTFAEELDQAIRFDNSERVVEPADRGVQPAPAAPHIFINPQIRIHATMGRTFGAERVRREVPLRARAVAPPRPSWTLNETQQRAFDGLLALGANLDRDFTASDLRRAFRVLARKYHPDRYPAGTPEQLARLSTLFTSLSDHYRCLLAVVERRNQQ